MRATRQVLRPDPRGHVTDSRRTGKGSGYHPIRSWNAKYVMKVTIEQANLLSALNHVHRVVERRNTIPILSNVLLRAEGNDLYLKATDLDLEIIDRAFDEACGLNLWSLA